MAIVLLEQGPVRLATLYDGKILPPQKVRGNSNGDRSRIIGVHDFSRDRCVSSQPPRLSAVMSCEDLIVLAFGNGAHNDSLIDTLLCKLL